MCAWVEGDRGGRADSCDRIMSSGDVTITAYKDGPYLLRGPFKLRDQQGQEIPAPRRVVALCRCGKSQIRPFCDGTHQLIDFRAPSGVEREPALTHLPRSGRHIS